MPCPAPYLWMCTCPAHTAIRERPGIAYYPASALLRKDGGIYTLLFPSTGTHYVDAVVDSIASGGFQWSPAFLMCDRVCHNITTEVAFPWQDGQPTWCTAWWTVLACNRQVRRIQAWLRQALERGRARRLATAMALHPRLGKDCLLGGLGADLLGLVCNGEI